MRNPPTRLCGTLRIGTCSIWCSALSMSALGHKLPNGRASRHGKCRGDSASPQFETANRLLGEAERIFFLGFGFHPDNVRRFNYFSPDAPAENVGGTLTMDSSIERREVVSRLRRDGVISVDGALLSHNCDHFFSHDARLPDE